jgi:hypothetical protein
MRRSQLRDQLVKGHGRRGAGRRRTERGRRRRRRRRRKGRGGRRKRRRGRRRGIFFGLGSADAGPVIFCCSGASVAAAEAPAHIPGPPRTAWVPKILALWRWRQRGGGKNSVHCQKVLANMLKGRRWLRLALAPARLGIAKSLVAQNRVQEAVEVDEVR